MDGRTDGCRNEFTAMKMNLRDTDAMTDYTRQSKTCLLKQQQVGLNVWTWISKESSECLCVLGGTSVMRVEPSFASIWCLLTIVEEKMQYFVSDMQTVTCSAHTSLPSRDHACTPIFHWLKWAKSSAPH